MGRALRLGLVLALALLFPATVALAQGVVTQIKTVPHQNSDTFTLHISIHNTAPGGPGSPANPPWAGWAGAIMEMHLLDNTELDIDAIHTVMPMHVGALTPPDGRTSAVIPASGLLDLPFGPRSNQLVSVPRDLTFWHPAAPNSGIPITGSVNQPLGTGFFHVKGSNPAGNSDVDAVFRFWNIWHITGQTMGSTLIQLGASDKIWVTSNFQEQQQLHNAQSFYLFPPTHPTPFQPNAHWLHLTQTATFHLTAFAASAFYATHLNTATLGVEHVPEPASAGLVALGLVSLAVSRTMRRQRLAVA